MRFDTSAQLHYYGVALMEGGTHSLSTKQHRKMLNAYGKNRLRENNDCDVETENFKVYNLGIEDGAQMRIQKFFIDKKGENMDAELSTIRHYSLDEDMLKDVYETKKNGRTGFRDEEEEKLFGDLVEELS